MYVDAAVTISYYQKEKEHVKEYVEMAKQGCCHTAGPHQAFSHKQLLQKKTIHQDHSAVVSTHTSNLSIPNLLHPVLGKAPNCKDGYLLGDCSN